ncbi:hypothetical protein [Streptomyces sp. enrichment culture]|uniref:hypothetical protein n=1 Tax=Streptomyces sp. enrichment culture TaxID=1795815 RepID=UPI003F55056A
MTTHRYTTAGAYTLLMVGIAAGVLGLLSDNQNLWHVGLFLAITAVPLIVTRTIQHCQQVSEQALADADWAGYRRGLEHAARGLLDAPAPTGPGHHTDRAEQTTGVVIPLRPHHTELHRKAQ